MVRLLKSILQLTEECSKFIKSAFGTWNFFSISQYQYFQSINNERLDAELQWAVVNDTGRKCLFICTFHFHFRNSDYKMSVGTEQSTVICRAPLRLHTKLSIMKFLVRIKCIQFSLILKLEKQNYCKSV